MYSPKVTSPKSANILLNNREGENKGFRPPSSFVRDGSDSTETNAKKGNIYVVKNDIFSWKNFFFDRRSVLGKKTV